MARDWNHIQAVATDIDGTLTTSGVFSAEVLRALHGLKAAGLKLILVTGRPSGWVQGLVSYLPVDAAIAENGGVIFLGAEKPPLLRQELTGNYKELSGEDNRKPLELVFAALRLNHPHLRVTEDNFYRLSDFTFHVDGLSADKLGELKAEVEKLGCAFTWSTIHAHIMPSGQQKGSAVQWLLQHFKLANSPASTTLTIGDSPNDSSLFEERIFPYSAGVANIEKYRAVMDFFPNEIALHSEGNGFVEIANSLLQLKGKLK